jgi:membrane protein
MNVVRRISIRIRRLIRQPRSELNRAQRVVRFAIDLCRHGWNELWNDRATDMAAALTYRTIFSLVPVAVLSMLAFRVFMSDADVEDVKVWAKEGVYDFLGWSAVALPLPGEDHPPIEAPPPGGGPSRPADVEQAELQASLEQKIDELIDTTGKLSFGSIGVLGTLLFIWAAVALLVSIEDSFNVIYGCPARRSWYARITTYWSVLTLGPVLVFAVLFAAYRLVAWGREVQVFGAATGTLLAAMEVVAGLAATWLLLLLMYRWMPNGQVALRPALVGSFVAAVLFELGKSAFAWYVKTALPYSALYGSLALIPLFLFWLYVTWLVILFGLELSYTLQALGHGKFDELEHEAARDRQACDPQWLLPLLARVAQAFREGKLVSDEELSRDLGLPHRTVAVLGQHLTRARMVHRVAGAQAQETGYTLARPPEAIRVWDILDLGQRISQAHRATHRDDAGWSYVARLLDAQRTAADGDTLADVLRHPAVHPPAAAEELPHPAGART